MSILRTKSMNERLEPKQIEEIKKEDPLADDLIHKEELPLIYKRAEWKVKMEAFLENYIVVGFMALVTIYSLFFDDIRAAAFEEEDDDLFYGFTFACMILFMVEILLSSLSR